MHIINIEILTKDTKQPMLTRRTPSAPKQSFPTLHPFNPVDSIYVRIQAISIIRIYYARNFNT